MDEGRCRCGEVTVRLTGAPKWVSSCHCKECRKATGSAFATYVGCRRPDVAIDGPVERYASSPGVTRWFCRRCGSPVAFQGERWPDETHLFIGIMDHPEAFAPKLEVYAAEALPWVHTRHELRRFDQLVVD